MSERGRKEPVARKRQGITPPQAPKKRQAASRMAEARDKIQRRQHRETLQRVRQLMGTPGENR